MPPSIFLAKAIGIYFVVMAIIVLAKRKSIEDMTKDLASSPAALYLTAIVTFILGLLMVLSHNVWVKNWRVLVTIFGWLALAKGLAFFLAPKALMNWSVKSFKPFIPVACIGMLIFGGYLLYIGFFVA